MSTNMTGFRWFSKFFIVLVLRTEVALALEGLILEGLLAISFHCSACWIYPIVMLGDLLDSCQLFDETGKYLNDFS